MYKRSSGVKKVVSNPQKAIMSLARQVKSLQKKTKVITENDTYYVSTATDVAAPFAAWNLSNYTTWVKAWATATNTAGNLRSAMYHKSFYIDNLVTLDNINNEEGTVNFTYMIISRRDVAGTATDTYASLSLTANDDYLTGSTNGFVYMNLKKWKVHAVRRFTLTQMDIDGADSSVCQKRFNIKVKVGKKIEAGDANWKTLENSPDPSDTYYAVLFNDNLSTDLESPRWSFTCMHNVSN